MDDRRTLSAREVADLVTGLRALAAVWSWQSSEVDGIVERFGWRVESRRGRSVRLDAGFGMGSGYVYLANEEVEKISVAAGHSMSAESRQGRAFVQDCFALTVAAVTETLGEPTERTPGEFAGVRWRDTDATIGVRHHRVQANIYLATNSYIDNLDWAASRGL